MPDKPDLTYTWEKLHIAVRGIAVDEGNLKTRLYNSYLAWMTLDPSDFPPDLAPRFAKLHQSVTAITPYADEGSLKATIDTFTDDYARHAIEEIVSLYDAVARLIGP